MTKHQEIEREIAELRRRIQEIERTSFTLNAEEPLPETGSLLALVCHCEQGRMALPLSTIERIIPAAATTFLPEAPPWIQGLLRVRGQTIAVLDLAARIGRQSREMDVDDHIILCNHEGALVGLVVNEVLGVQTFTLNRIAQADSTPGIPRAPYVRASLQSADGLVLLLSLKRLIETSDMPPPSPMDGDAPKDRREETAA